MVAITVILAAVIAAFVLDIGPGDADPNAAVEVDNQSNSADISLTSLDSGSTDGVAVVADQTVEVDDDDDIYGDGFVIAILDTSGEEVTIEWNQDIDADEDDWDHDEVDFSVRSFSGENLEEEENINDDADSQSIEEEFTLEDPSDD